MNHLFKVILSILSISSRYVEVELRALIMSYRFYAPNFEKVGAYWFRFVRVCVCFLCVFLIKFNVPFKIISLISRRAIR